MPGPSEGPRRIALIVATSVYQEQTLAHLRAPGTDAKALAEVLADERIGGFEVQTFLNTGHDQLMRGVLEVCGSTGPGDFLLVYLSCHGVMDDRGRLYYATTDTERRLLAATAVSANWLNEQLEDCRARRQVLLLDCCHSGAFAKGSKGGKGDSPLALQEQFPGRGKVVLTASRATEYSFEGENVVGQGVSSVFTRAIVDGLRTGEADVDSDGDVTVTDLYQYVYDRVRQAESRQTPGMWTYGSEGELLLARSVREVRPAELPEDLVHVLASPRPRVRASGVAELAELLDKGPRDMALAAEMALGRMAAEEVPSVASLARVALGTAQGHARDAVQTRIQGTLEPPSVDQDPGGVQTQDKPRDPAGDQSQDPAGTPSLTGPSTEARRAHSGQDDVEEPEAEVPVEEREPEPVTDEVTGLPERRNRWWIRHRADRNAGDRADRLRPGARPAYLVAAGILLVLAGSSRLIREFLVPGLGFIHPYYVMMAGAEVLLVFAGLPFRFAAGRWLLWGAAGTTLCAWLSIIADTIGEYAAYAALYNTLYVVHSLCGIGAAAILAFSPEAGRAVRWLLAALYVPHAFRVVVALTPVAVPRFLAVYAIGIVLAGLAFVLVGAASSRRTGARVA